MTRNLFSIIPLFFFAGAALAVTPDQKNLPIGLAPEEMVKAFASPEQRIAGSPMPQYPIHSLGEWEEAESVFTLWTNPSFIRALQSNGPVTILADSSSDRSWWSNWLNQNKIPSANISFSIVPTDSIWVRDYGPWFILDGNGQFGVVDTIYNRPRPLDDKVPEFVAESLKVPLFKTGLVHAGGNYYPDGLANAFSSTLVYSENSKLSRQEIDARMLDYLGIERYTTSKLGPGISIEHIDTYGKLVAPDTWVIGEFPSGSKYRQDSEAFVAKIKSLISPYGTPYKIYRLPMVKKGFFGEDYRAYINAFISNKTLYFPLYGDSSDNTAKQIYQNSLPGYRIVGVDADGTSWGDSVHCRARNLLRKDTTFIFPHVNLDNIASLEAEIEVEVITALDRDLAETPSIVWEVNGSPQSNLEMEHSGGNTYSYKMTDLPRNARISFYIEAKDNTGLIKTAPINAPAMKIDFNVK